MSNSTELPDAVIGTAEPSSSRIMLVLLSVVAIGMFGLFSTIFGWDNIPVIGDVVPLMSNLGGSGIWYYLLGFIIGIGAIVSTLAGEVISGVGDLDGSSFYRIIFPLYYSRFFNILSPKRNWYNGRPNAPIRPISPQ